MSTASSGCLGTSASASHASRPSYRGPSSSRSISSSPSPPAASASAAEALRLRRAARLVHCIQKERGASCTLCALASSSSSSPASAHTGVSTSKKKSIRFGRCDSEGCDDLSSTTTTEGMLLLSVRRTRRSSDAALSALSTTMCGDGFGGELPVREELSKIRAAVDAAASSGEAGGEEDDDDSGFPFHRVLVSFNALIASTIQKYVVRACEAIRRSRSLAPGLSRDDEPVTLDSGANNSDNDDADPGSPSMDECECERAVASSLLSIFLSFVCLKESTGVERAALSSLMAMGEQQNRKSPAGTTPKTLDDGFNHGGAAVLFSDLVLEEENRRRIVRDLSNVAKHGSRHGLRGARIKTMGARRIYDESYRSILALVDQAVRPDPEMEAAHNAVRVDFDLEAFQRAMSLEEFWAGITAYMDRLHSMELLVAEEIECCLEVIDAAAVAKMEQRPAKVAPEPEKYDAPEFSAIRAREVDNSSDHRDEKKMPDKKPSSKMLAANGKIKSTKSFHSLIQALYSEGKPKEIEIEELSAAPPDELKASLLEILRAEATWRKDRATTCSTFASTNSSPAFSSGGKRPEEAPPSLNLPPSVSDGGDPASDPTLRDWTIDPYELQFRKRIGQGGAGTTYLAHWGSQRVAVKVAAVNDMGLEGWSAEVCALRRLHHPNVIRLLGCIYNPSPRTYGLVLEYCDAGDLAQALDLAEKKSNAPRIFLARGGGYGRGYGLSALEERPSSGHQARQRVAARRCRVWRFHGQAYRLWRGDNDTGRVCQRAHGRDRDVSLYVTRGNSA